MPSDAVDQRDAPTAAMRVTTVRFGHDLWRLLESEAALVGTSVSQYIREASLARAAAAAAARGESAFERLASTGDGQPGEPEALLPRAPAEKPETTRKRAALAQEEARALRAESSQARARARSSRRTPD